MGGAAAHVPRMEAQLGKRIVLLGPPGAGKGTQAKLMQEQTGMSHISTGDLLRAAIASGSPIGKEAHAYMERGELVPDAVAIRMIEDRLARAGENASFILDGFPRTVAQADTLERMLADKHIPLDHVMNIEIPRDEVVRRLSGRRTCALCGAMFHTDFDPPCRPDVCDRCGGELYQRDDDREETIRARLDVYDKATKPLAAFYRSRGLLRDIDGTGTAAQVLERMRAQLNGRH